MSVLTLLSHHGPLLADALAGSLWQGLLVTVLAVLAIRIFGPWSAAARVAIWTGLLFVLLALPLASLALGHPAGRGGEAVHAEPMWGLLLLGLWLAGSLYHLLRLGRTAWRLRGISRRAMTLIPEASVAAMLESPRRVQLCVSQEVDRPCVLGLTGPKILLPPQLAATLTLPEMQQIVLHEMEHLRRRDDWRDLLQQISLVLLPLHPAVLWLDRRLCHERELACDDGVLRATASRKAYAACLLKVAEDTLLRRRAVLALSALGTRAKQSELGQRVTRILAGADRGGSSPGTNWAIGAVLSFAVIMAASLGTVAPRLVSFDRDSALQASVPGEGSSALLGALPARVGPSVDPGSHRMVQAGFEVKPQDQSPLPVTSTAAMVPAVARTGDHAGMRVAKAVRTGVRHAGGGSPASWRKAAYATGGILARSSVARERIRERAILTDFRVSQPVFAAVPWRGGWLIVQL